MNSAAVQRLLDAANNYDAVLIMTEVGRRYLSGFAASDGAMIVSPKGCVLFMDSRYFEAASAAVRGCEVRLYTDAAKQLGEAFSELSAKKVAVETSLTVREYQNLARMLEPVGICADSAVDGAVSSCREIKSHDEVSRIVDAQRIAETAFEHILDFIRPGVSETDIAAELEYFMRKNGAGGISFETIAVTGAKTSMPHGVPDGKRVQSGDFVTMDFGAVVDGYHSDMTRTVAVGSVSGRMREVYDTVLRAQLAAIDAIGPGVCCADADRAARDVISGAGFGDYFRHSTGHSVGLEIHESPNLSPRSRAELRTGNVVTVEPGIYLPGEFGVRIEDMVLITDSGCENLTKSPKELIIL